MPASSFSVSQPFLRPLALAAALFLAGCAATPVKEPALPAPQAGNAAHPSIGADSEPQPRKEPLPDQELTPQILYQMLLAEIAGQRGDLQLSVTAYLDLARSTRDPRIARRAAEIAQYARQYEAALEAAELWLSVDPESLLARQTVVSLLAGMGRFAELQPHVAGLLTADPAKIPEGLMRLNRLFVRHGDRASARQVIFALTEPYLRYPEAHYARAQAAQLAGDAATAVAELDEALRLRPTWDQAVMLKAQIQAEKSPAEAFQTLRGFLDTNPKSREVRLQFARVLTGDRRYDEARAEFQKLLGDFPNDPNVLFAVGALSFQLQDYTSAEKSFRQLVDLEFSDQNTVRLYLGQIAENQKKLAEALDWYGAITPGEQYIPARIRLANVLAQSGRLDQARQELQETTASTERERVQLLLAEAQILRDAGHAQQAFDVLDRALAAQPNQPELLYETALMAERIGRYDLFESYLGVLIQMKPDHAHAYNALGYSLADRNERLEEAQQYIAKALEYAPDDPFILDSMGWVLYRRGELQRAADYLQRGLRMRSDPEIAAHLGEVLWMMGRQDEARRTWRDAQKANPGSEVLTNVIKRFDP